MSFAQPVPNVTPEDVEIVVRRDFPADEYVAVMAVLNDYGTKSRHRERSRVQLAALKTANANVQKLRACIESAKRDYRDALAAPEYPAYCQILFGRSANAEDRNRIIESDWRQYEDWLKRSG